MVTCLWNLEDDYYIVNNKPCTFFNGENNGLFVKKLTSITEEAITVKEVLISFKFSEQENGLYTNCCIIPNHFAIFKNEIDAKNYMIEMIDAHKNTLETFKPAI